MAVTKATLCIVLLCLIFVQEVYDVHAEGSPAKDANKIDCGAKCLIRCSKAKSPKMCKRACNTCCTRCNCVPPGTVGNRDVCPCYATMKTHKGKLKCP